MTYIGKKFVESDIMVLVSEFVGEQVLTCRLVGKDILVRFASTQGAYCFWMLARVSEQFKRALAGHFEYPADMLDPKKCHQCNWPVFVLDEEDNLYTPSKYDAASVSAFVRAVERYAVTHVRKQDALPRESQTVMARLAAAQEKARNIAVTEIRKGKRSYSSSELEDNQDSPENPHNSTSSELKKQERDESSSQPQSDDMQVD
jgi:hypothetical protein